MSQDMTYEESLEKLADHPQDLSRYKRLEEDHVQDWEDHVWNLASHASEASDGAASARLYLEAGRAALERVGDPEWARQLLEEASGLVDDPSINREARLVQLAAHGDQQALFGFFRQALQASDNGTQQARLYLRMGGILERVLDDPAEAESAYGYARDLLEQAISEVPGAERKYALLCDLADIYRDDLRNGEAAVECYRAASDLWDGDELRRAERALEALTDESGDPDLEDGESAEPRDSDVEAGEEPAAEAAAEEESDVSEQVAEEPVSSVEELEAPPEVDQIDEPEAPELPEEAAAPEIPEEPEESTAEETSAPSEAIEEEETGAATDEPAGAAEAPEGADPALAQRAVESEDADEFLLWSTEAALLSWLRGREPAQDLVPLWEEAAQRELGRQLWERTHFLVADPDFWQTVLQLLDESADGHPGLRGRIALYDLGDAELGRQLAESIEDEGLQQGAEHLERARENWRRLQRDLEKEYREASKEEKARQVYGHLADVARGIGDPDREVDVLRRMDREVDDPAVSHRLMVGYRTTEKWPRYVDLVKEHAETFDEDYGDEKAVWLREAVRIYRDEMNHDMMVVNTYRDIREAKPGDLGALDALIDKFEEMNRSSELINALQEKAELVDDVDQKIELLSRVARLFLDKFRNQAEAIDAYESVLELDATHPEALDALQEMYEKRRDWKKLVDVKRREVETLEDPQARLEGLKDVAQLAADRLRKPDVATELWREVLEESPGDRQALDALEKLYDKARDWSALADVLEQKCERVDEPEIAMKLHRKLGKLCSDRLEDPERAMKAWKGALELDPDDRAAQKSLERLYVDHRQWDDLEAFYRQRDELRELVRMLETLSGTLEEESARLQVLVRAGRLWRGELEEPDRAKRNLEKALEIDEDDPEIAAELEPIYRADEDWKGLRRVLTVLLESSSDPEERRSYELELARLHRERLSDPEGAYRWYAEAFQSEPAGGELLDALAASAEAAGTYDDLADVWESALERDLAAELETEIRVRLGGLLFEELSDTEGALRQYDVLLDEDPHNQRALAGLESVYEAEGRWDELIEVYRTRLELTDSDSDRVEILHGMARLAERQKGDRDEAVQRLREALDLEPRNRDILAEMHRLYREMERFTDLIETIDREIDVLMSTARERAETAEPIEATAEEAVFGQGEAPEFEPDVQQSERRFQESDVEAILEMRREKGMVLKDQLDRHAEALDEFAEILNWRPGADEARVAVEGYLDDRDYGPRAAEILEPIYHLMGRWEDLVDVLDVRLTAAEGDEAEALLESKASVQLDALDRRDDAFRTYGRLLRREPGHQGAREQLESLADEGSRWRDLAELYEEVLDTADSELLQVDYGMALGDIWADRLEAPEEADRYYLDVLEAEPGHDEALDRLESVYRRTEAWQRLLDIYDRKLDGADPAALESLRFERGGLLDEKLDRPHEAIATLEDILEAEPGHPEALEARNELLERRGMWAELADALEDTLEVVDGEDALETTRRLAEVYDRELDRPGEAVDLYESILDQRPEDEHAISALESLMWESRGDRARVSRILEPIYRERSDWKDLVDALDVQIQSSEDGSDRLELLHRIASIEEQRRDRPDAAFSRYLEALEVEPGSDETLSELERLAEELGRWHQLQAALVERAEATSGPTTARRLFKRAADIRIEELEQPSEAIPVLQRVIGRVPEDLETARQLEELCRELEQWEDLVDILRHRAEIEEETEDTKELLYQAGIIYDDLLERPERAVDVYREVLEYDGADTRAIDQLEELYTRLERWTDLLDIYNRKLGLIDDPEARKDLLYAIGPIHEDQLDEPYEAIGIYRDILALDDDELSALERLADLYEQTEQWNELLETLQAQRELVSLPEERQHLEYRIGRLWERELGDIPRAVEVYRGILEEDSKHEGAREALSSMIERGVAEAEASEVLHPVLEQSGEWEQLVEVKRHLIEAAADPARKLELYREIATLYEERIDEPVDALEAYLDAIEIEPTSQHDLDEAERLAGELTGWDVYIDWLEGLLDDAVDGRVVVELNRRIGRVLDQELGEPAEAVRYFERALEADPEHPEVLKALDELYRELETWEELPELLRTRILITDDSQQALELRTRLGQVYQDALKRPGQAIDVFQQLLEDHPEHEVAVESLEELFTEGHQIERIVSILEPWYRQRDRHEKLVDLYDRRLQRLEDPHERFDLLEQAAELSVQQLDAPQKALEYYGAALRERPDVESVAERLRDLAAQTESWETVAGSFFEAIEDNDLDDRTSLELWRHLADILDHELGWMDDAEDAYRSILSIEPTHTGALEALDRIYRETDADELLADVLERRLQATNEPATIIELELRRGAIYEESLDRPDEAIGAYEHLLELEPGHEQALERLETIHRSREAWEALFDVLERRAETTSDPDRRVEAYAQMALLAEEMLERPHEAIDLWRQVLDQQPDHRDALDELQRLYRQESLWDELVEILERKLDLVEDPEHRLNLNESLARVWTEELGSPGPAVDAWRSVLQIDADHLEALEQLDDLYVRQGNDADLEEILQRLVAHDAVSDDQRLQLWERLGRLRQDRLMDPEGAIEAWTRVTDVEPGHIEALDCLEDLYLQEARWEEAAAVLDAKAEQAEDPEDRVALLRRMAELWEQRVGDREQAASVYQRILDMRPADREAFTSLENLYRSAGTDEAYSSLVGLYVERAEVVDDSFERMEALQQGARVLEDQLENPSHAQMVLLEAYDVETADDEQLLSELTRLAETTGDWMPMVERFTKVAKELDDTSRAADLHERIGRIYADTIEQPDEAIYHLRRALDIEPGRDELLELLQTMYRRIEAWPEMAGILRDRIDHEADPDAEVELWRSLGEIYDEQLDQPDDAIEAYREILSIDADDRMALESLERLYQQQGRWTELIDVLERKVETTYEPDEIVSIRQQIARIQESHLDRPQEAVRAWHQVLEVEQDNEKALDALERINFELEAWDDLIDVYDRRLEVTHEPQAQVELYDKMAVVYEEQRDAPADAIEAYRQILMVDPENIEAMENLERLYRAREQWFDLVDILQQHNEVVSEEDERVALLNELARVRRDRLEDAYAAIESFESSLDVEPQQPNVLFDVAELHESTSNWQQAIEAYRRLIEFLDEPADRVDVFYTIGEVYESELADDENAAEAFRDALDIEPTHTPSREAIEEIYARRGQWEALVEVYLDAVEATDDFSESAVHLARIGEIYEDELDDRANALNYYEQALEEDPHELSAAEPLIDLYIERDAWERAVPLLEMVIERYRESEDPHREELQTLHGQLARVYEGLQQDEKALEEYRHAFEMDARNVDVLMGLGRLLFNREEKREAGRMLQQVEDDHLATLEQDDLQELYVMLGEIRREAGDVEEAVDALERVVEHDPDHSEALESLAKLYQETERWDEAIDVTRQLLDAEDDDPAMRFSRWTRIGDMCAEHTDDPNRAIEAYQAALDAKPGSVAVLRKLLEIYKSTEQWHSAVDVLAQLVELQDDATRRAKFLYTSAIIQRDKMGDVESALETFEEALDEDLERLEAFEAIDRIYTRRKDWKGLERAYRRMLRRIAETGGGRDEIKFKLWEGLGEIYRSRLGHPKSAIKAFETATQLQPDSERIRLILADLYQKTGENLEGAIEQHRKMLRNDPLRIESYKALFGSYLKSEEYDRAWCMAAALDFLQEADDKEQAYFEKYRTQNLRRADKFFDQEAWDLLYHEDQNMLISHIMSILGQGLRQQYADELKRWDLHSRKDKLDLDKGTLFANVFTYAAETTGIAPVPNVYLKSDQAFGIRNANVQPPAIVAGADVVQNRPARELAFRLGKLLASMRSEHYLGSLSYPTEFLKMLFMAAMHVTNDNLGLESQLGESGMLWVEEIQNMPSQMQMQLRQNVSQFLKTGENPNLSVWLKHVEYTTNRVGLTLCGDLKEAAQIVKTDRNQTISKASTREKIEELILFSISDEYSELRRKLGLAID